MSHPSVQRDAQAVTSGEEDAELEVVSAQNRSSLNSLKYAKASVK